MGRLVEKQKVPYVDNSERLRQAFDLFVTTIQATINEGCNANVTLRINLSEGKIGPNVEINTVKRPKLA